MRSREATIDDVVAMISSGSRVGLGGVLDRRRPLAACSALAAAGRKDLRVWSFLAGREVQILAEADAMSQLFTGYVDPKLGPAALASIDKGRVQRREMSEHIFVGGLAAASAGLPFWPTIGGTGSDVAAELGLRDVMCPYTGTRVIAVPATPLDVTILHAAAATRFGAVLGVEEREFLADADVTIARAATRVVVTVDRWFDEALDGPLVARAMLASFEVDAVVCVGMSSS